MEISPGRGRQLRVGDADRKSISLLAYISFPDLFLSVVVYTGSFQIQLDGPLTESAEHHDHSAPTHSQRRHAGPGQTTKIILLGSRTKLGVERVDLYQIHMPRAHASRLQQM